MIFKRSNQNVTTFRTPYINTPKISICYETKKIRTRNREKERKKEHREV